MLSRNYNFQVPSKCNTNTQMIKHLKTQINTLAIQRRQIMFTKRVSRADLIDMEEMSATISKYQRKITELEMEDSECEVDFWNIETSKEYDV